MKMRRDDSLKRALNAERRADQKAAHAERRAPQVIVNIIHNNTAGEINRREVVLNGNDHYDRQRMAEGAIALIRDSGLLEVGDTIVIGEEIK